MELDLALPEPGAGGRLPAAGSSAAVGAEAAEPSAWATELPVARVAVDTGGLAHLDRAFDYAVPATLDAAARAGCRVRVRFSGRLVDGLLLERVAATDHPGRLSVLASVHGGPALVPEVAALARAVADRCAGSLYDVLRLALPPRHAAVEKAIDAAPLVPWQRPERLDDAGPWSRYPAGPALLRALAEGRSPRAVWTSLPGPSRWPEEVAVAVRACASSGRGAVVVVPDSRDVARVAAALDVPHVALEAGLGPRERYRRWLRLLRDEHRVVIGTRAAAWAPVRDLGLVVVWDDGDDLHAEPRSPYPHVREVLALRAHLTGAAALVGGIVRTAEGQLLVESGWAAAVEPDRAVVRASAPRVVATSDDSDGGDPLARAARLPATAFRAARAALAEGAPVLVQVPRRGWAPALACSRDRTAARCPACAGPLGGTSGPAPACRWCGRLAVDWRCPACSGTALRAVVVGARRTADELGRAFPGVTVRTSGGDDVLASVPAEPALVVSTPGAEPVADGGYGAVLLLDAAALLSRADLRAAEEALRRWAAAAALARAQAPVVLTADAGAPQAQALVRWDPAWAAERELAGRTELGFPPAVRMAAVDGAPAAVAEAAAALASAEPALELLGPVELPDRDGEPAERLLVRAPRGAAAHLAAELKALQARRSAAKAAPLRVAVDPVELL